MQSTFTEVALPQHTNHGVTVLVRFGPQRGKPMPRACDSHTVVERVVRNAQLDAVTREQLVRILTITVQQWVCK